MDTLELLAHPVRLRVVHALSGGRALTTSELCEVIADVSPSTVYRRVGQLVDAGLLEVVGERRVRGAVERTYRLRPERAVIDADAAASVTTEDHRRIFAIAMATLIAEFNTYLDRQDGDPARDEVGYRQHAVWLSPSERAELIERMREAIVPVLGNQPTEERSRHLLSPILFPAGTAEFDPTPPA